MKYHIITFGCQMNYADSERIAGYYESCGFKMAKNEKEADLIVINTCVVRQKAEDRIYGLVKNLSRLRQGYGGQAELKPWPKIILTGCFVGAMEREQSGRIKKYAKQRMPEVDEFVSAEKFGFNLKPRRCDYSHAWLPISNGCNNMCSYCIVPHARGKEVSRPFEEILAEAEGLKRDGYTEITLLGQNVNSYGSDLFACPASNLLTGQEGYRLPGDKAIKPIIVKSMGRTRIPTLFPCLLEEIAKMPFKKVTFISSNPWDFSDELIDVIYKYKNINREIHLPVQSGDNKILQKMNRRHTREEYLDLIKRIRAKVPEVKFTTDIIAGFPGETEKQFQQTVDLCQQVGFNVAYIACYSPRPGTAAEKMENDVKWGEKKRRFHVLDDLINKKHITHNTKQD